MKEALSPSSPPKTAIGRGVFIGIALPLALYLSVALTLLGVEKFHYVLAGGKRFATFPNSASHLGISLSYLALVLLHLVWFLGTPSSAYSYPKFSKILQRTGVFLVLAYGAYPLGNDIYLYLHSGLMNLSHVDPFRVQAGAFTSELSTFVDWKQTSTYGPISQLLFTGSAALVAIHPILAIYGLKVFCLIAHIANGFLIWKILPPNLQGKLAIAYLLSPVLLMEQVGSAHVDVFVATSILLMALCLFKGLYSRAFLAIWGGFLTKTIPVIWLPLLLCFLVRKRRWDSLLLGLLASIAIAIGLWKTVLPSPESWSSLLNPGVVGQYQSSLPALLRAWLETFKALVPEAPSPTEQKYWLLQFSRYVLIGFAAFYVWVVLQIFRRPSYSSMTLLEDMGWVTLVLMLYATSWLMPWYVSILYAMAAVLPSARLFGLTVLMFGVSSSAMYWLQGDAGLRSLMAIGLPTFTILAGSWVLKGERKQRGQENLRCEEQGES